MSYHPETDRNIACSNDYYCTTSFIPLPTTFTPPAQCYDLLTNDSYERATVFALPASGTSSTVEATPCLPTEVSSSRYAGTDTQTALALGPFTCPDQYTQIYAAIYSYTRTLLACCPSGYTSRPFTSQLLASDRVCTSVLASGAPYDRVLYSGSTTYPTTASADITVLATALSGWIIDQSASVTAYATSISTGNSNNLGMTIGMGVGVSIGVILLAFLIAFFSLRSRAKQRPTLQHGDTGVWPTANNDAVNPPGMHSTAVMQSPYAVSPLFHQQYAELDTTRPVSELHSPTNGPGTVFNATRLISELHSPTHGVDTLSNATRPLSELHTSSHGTVAELEANRRG